MKEINDGSVQELLQKLFKAESVVKERERRVPENTSWRNRRYQGRISEHGQDTLPEGNKSSETSKQTDRTEGRNNSKPEIGLQSVKCFKCSKLGHVAT